MHVHICMSVCIHVHMCMGETARETIISNIYRYKFHAENKNTSTESMYMCLLGDVGYENE